VHFFALEYHVPRTELQIDCDFDPAPQIHGPIRPDKDPALREPLVELSTKRIQV
jgi:hypothetical protein